AGCSMRDIMRLLLVSALAVLLPACNSGTLPDSGSTQVWQLSQKDPPDISLLPALASLPLLPRAGSAAEILVRQGDEAISSGGSNAFTEPTALTLSPVANELGYAIYGFALPEQTES